MSDASRAPRTRNDAGSCYHEAGHCAAFLHYDIPIDRVEMKPAAETGHRARTILITPRVPPESAALDTEMKCAAAGEIAQRRYLGFKPLTEGQLLTEFRWNEKWARENLDAETAPTDGTIFSLSAVLRDKELEEIDPAAVTGHPRWLAVWREADELVGDLWLAITDIAFALMATDDYLPGEEIAALAAATRGRRA